MTKFLNLKGVTNDETYQFLSLLKQALTYNYRYYLFPFLYWLANFFSVLDIPFVFGMECNYGFDVLEFYYVPIDNEGCCCFVVVVDEVVVLKILIQHGVHAALLGK